MFADFFRAFAGLFTQRRSRLEVSGLLLAMAMLPISELVVTRLFAHLILKGPAGYRADPDGVVVSASIFFLAFALSRAVHHVVRLNRVRVFRRGFESSRAEHKSEHSSEHRSGSDKPRGQEAWSWAAAFELSTAMVALIQVAAFCGLFTWVDWRFGLGNVVVVAAVLALVAGIYRRQLAHQHRYLAEGAAGTAVGDRVGRRIRDAELGAVVSSVAMAVSLLMVLVLAVRGGLAGADAIVLFIGLRMLYSQMGNLSASAMRFARVKARLDVRRPERAGAAADVDADADGDAEVDVDDGEVSDDTGELAVRPPASPHRTRLVEQMVLAGQRGDDTSVRRLGGRLARGASADEIDARAAAEAFAAHARPVDGVQPVRLAWWARPYPGTAPNWASPLLLGRRAERPVVLHGPGAGADQPHLLLAGAILGSARPGSIVAGAGALDASSRPDTAATYLSVRGPLSAVALRAAGGPSIDALGDPLALTSRLVPVAPQSRGDDLLLVRHLRHAGVRLTLPDGVTELDVRASHPDDVVAFAERLAGARGVVTSDPGVAVMAQSYGVPTATVLWEDDDPLAFVFDDSARGLGLGGAAAQPTVVSADLRDVRLEDLLAVSTPAPAVLDEIGATLDDALALCLERTLSGL